MNRRAFLAWLSAIPILGRFVPAGLPAAESIRGAWTGIHLSPDGSQRQIPDGTYAIQPGTYYGFHKYLTSDEMDWLNNQGIGRTYAEVEDEHGKDAIAFYHDMNEPAVDRIDE